MSQDVGYTVLSGSGAPGLQEASGEFKTRTILLDKDADLTAGTAGELPAGTLLVPDDDLDGRYTVLTDTQISGNKQDATDVVLLPTDVFDLGDAHRSIDAILVGRWTNARWYANGTIGASDLAKFNQRIILDPNGD